MPKWDSNILSKKLSSLIKLLANKKRKQKQKKIGQLLSSSKLII